MDTGSNVDWAHIKCNVPFAYNLELPYGGATGYDPPANLIQGVVDETWEGIRALVEHIVAASIE